MSKIELTSEIQHQLEKEILPLAEAMSGEMKTYWNYHRHRFWYHIQLIDKFLGKSLNQPTVDELKLLDIGPSFQTLILNKLYSENVVIDTLGFPDRKFPPSGKGKHHDFDLNDSYFTDRWLQVGPYDVVIMFEVIEHLYTSPSQVIDFLKSITKPNGIIYISTPNAVTLPKRLKMLSGRNPFEEIRNTRENPGHFRESTARELCEIGNSLGLEIVEVRIENLSSTGSWASRIFRGISPFLPSSLRKELHIVFRKIM